MTRPATATALLAALTLATAAAPTMKLEVSPNHHFLQTSDGKPFFYLGDTAWELFHRLRRDEAQAYLQTRAAQGFTVIQAVMLAEFDGLHKPNAYGKFPLLNDNPATPDTAPNGYWDHVDFIIQTANNLGLTIGALPTWGDKWNKAWGTGPQIFTPENAHAYGLWLGKRYRDANLIWILGGDRNIENDTHRAIITAMAEGLREGDAGTHLISYHPSGGRGSSEWFHEAPWLDFNMRQNGHEATYDRYSNTLKDYQRSPAKPVLDGEPLYEGHPISFNAKAHGHSTATDVRRTLYWDLFSGAFGHTYGHHSIWQFYDPQKRSPHNGPLCSWQEALHAHGATQLIHARNLLESLPFFTRIPADDVLVQHPLPTAVPGAGIRRFVATRDSLGSYILVYAPISEPFCVKLDSLSTPRCRARWMNPRSGEFTPIATLPTHEPQTFYPPELGEHTDWVLVLEALPNDTPPAIGPSHKPLTDADTPVVHGPDLLTLDGRPLLLQGLAICGLEWDPNEEHLETSLNQAIDSWNANVIRLAIHSSFWFGYDKKKSDSVTPNPDLATAYRARVDALIDSANKRGCYVVLDLHEYRAPTEKHAAFWHDAASHYANRPGVLFGVLNEAYGISWNEWRNGGSLGSAQKDGVLNETLEGQSLDTSIGHQRILETIRATGAKNVVVAGGLDWAYDLSGLQQGYDLSDPSGYGVLYDTHIYPWKSDWQHNVLEARKNHALFVGEIGAMPHPMPFQNGSTPNPYEWAPAAIAFLQRNGFHWTAWSFHCHADPNVLQDWNYTPTPYWGAFVRAALHGATYQNTREW